MARDKNIIYMSNTPCEKAYPTAVPRNGALQGVAKKVETIPVKKLFKYILLDLTFKKFVTCFGKNNSKNPNKLRPKKKRINAKKKIKFLL